jgi:hypothetical protein
MCSLLYKIAARDGCTAIFFLRSCTHTYYIKKERICLTSRGPNAEQRDYIGFNRDRATNPARHHNSSLLNTESATPARARDKPRKAWPFLCSQITHTTASTNESKALRRLLDTCLCTLVHQVAKKSCSEGADPC